MAQHSMRRLRKEILAQSFTAQEFVILCCDLAFNAAPQEYGSSLGSLQLALLTDTSDPNVPLCFAANSDLIGVISVPTEMFIMTDSVYHPKRM